MRSLVVVALALTGCRQLANLHLPGSSSLDSAPLRACAQGDVDAQLQIVKDLEASFPEMETCGRIAQDFYKNLGSTIVDTARGRAGALRYVGGGTFTTPNNVMTIRVLSNGAPIELDPLSGAMSFGLDNISVENRIDVRDQQSTTTIHYILGGTYPLDDVKEALKMQLVSIEATTATGQTIHPAAWNMRYSGHSLDGSIAIDVDGAFPYRATYAYANSGNAEVQLSCR